MKKTLAAILAVASSASVATAQNYVAIESFKNASVGTQESTTISANSDLDATSTYDSSYEYGGIYLEVVDDEATDYPTDLQTADGKYITLAGNDDQFFRSIASAAIVGTDNVASVAFAFRLDSLDAVAANNEVDYWRVLDINATGTAASIMAFTVRAGQLRIQTNGLGAVDVVDLSTLTLGTWYVVAARYDRTTDGAGTFDAYLLNQATNDVTTIANLTGLTASNKAEIGAIATAATFAAPTGTVDFQTSLDDFAIYSNTLSTSQLLTAVKADFGFPANANVSDWNVFN
ncbi:MAG: hypothetical protein ACFCU1_11965 [Sumerlaeia bacterium]